MCKSSCPRGERKLQLGFLTALLSLLFNNEAVKAKSTLKTEYGQS
jgi:hypothetical protein